MFVMVRARILRKRMQFMEMALFAPRTRDFNAPSLSHDPPPFPLRESCLLCDPCVTPVVDSQLRKKPPRRAPAVRTLTVASKKRPIAVTL